MKQFHCEVEPYEHVEISPTILLEGDNDGSIKAVCVESKLQALGSYEFSDFALQKCIDNGVSYKSLMIPSDFRIGSDVDFDAIDAAIESHLDMIYESKKS